MRKVLSLRSAAPLALTALLAVTAACNDDTATFLEPRGRTFNYVLIKEGSNVPRMTGGAMSLSRPANASLTQMTSTIAEINIQGLEKLAGSAGYVLWSASLVDAPDPAPPGDSMLVNIARYRTSDFIAIEADTTINSSGDFVPDIDTLQRQNTRAIMPTFNFGGPGVTYVVRSDSAALGVYPHNRTIIFVTVVADTAAPTTPATDGSDMRLWLRYPTTNPAASTTATTTATRTPAAAFGNGNASAAKQYLFIASGRGRGAVVPETNTMIVDDSLLARPPKGYYYETFLVKREDNIVFNAIDTISVGPQTAPAPRRNLSLYSADSTDIAGIVQNPPGFPALQLIYAAASRINCSGGTCTNSLGNPVPRLAATGNAYRKVANIYISLEHKLGTPLMSPAIILNGIAPAAIRTREN